MDTPFNPTPQICLLALNARYIHSSLALRYLQANMGELKSQSTIIECTINEKTTDIVEQVLKLNPAIVGISVYIWNAKPVHDLILQLNAIRPNLIIILGGPEVSWDLDKQPKWPVDFIIQGEAEITFPRVCKQILAHSPPNEKVIMGVPPDLSELSLPYYLYSEEDIAHRVIYIESTRGCPFSCEFCLSSRDRIVRKFPKEKILKTIETLYFKGVKHFKFLDRDITLGMAEDILNLFVKFNDPKILLHFEIIPHKIPDYFFKLLKSLPSGTVQLEMGIQSFNDKVNKNISRKQNSDLIIENILRIKNETDAHIHTDLIAGLPGENMESFEKGFNLLWSAKPHEIQVGILKRLWGAPLISKSELYGMVFDPLPPYEIFKTSDVSYEEMQRLKRFSRYFDMVSNSGNFVHTSNVILSGNSSFHNFMVFTKWLHQQSQQTHAISLNRLAEYLFNYLVNEKSYSIPKAAQLIIDDFDHNNRKKLPPFLKKTLKNKKVNSGGFNKRQTKHLDTGNE